ncbi:MAG: hypothetical protein IIT50_01745 [Bacteroidales bacterium]|jgi:hypothetical protein|nr:hypothetical protein [Bacteroidales bacterium]MBQ1636968.1 hypothetical protein [Bacteroidales bacterium]MBQ1679769.1 hypothetical protein [Bacteroidales bacterium]MBQ1755004.1 hypothetical protein [Bacteroidales bacterium]MBQ2148827.1 hypothetical protein [Bacteroidales bacterium]
MATGPSTYVKNIAPEKLELLIAIVNAPKVRFYTNLIQSSEANLYLAVQASGTSEKAIMNYLGLNQSNRSAIFSVVREDKLKDLLEVLDENFSTIKDGGGIAITVPLTSVIGTLVYGFLSNDKRTIKQ